YRRIRLPAPQRNSAETAAIAGNFYPWESGGGRVQRKRHNMPYGNRSNYVRSGKFVGNAKRRTENKNEIKDLLKDGWVEVTSIVNKVTDTRGFPPDISQQRVATCLKGFRDALLESIPAEKH